MVLVLGHAGHMDRTLATMPAEHAVALDRAMVMFCNRETDRDFVGSDPDPFCGRRQNRGDVAGFCPDALYAEGFWQNAPQLDARDLEAENFTSMRRWRMKCPYCHSVHTTPCPERTEVGYRRFRCYRLQRLE